MKGAARILLGIRGMLGIFTLLVLVPVLFTFLDDATTAVPVIGNVPATLPGFLLAALPPALVYAALRFTAEKRRHEELSEKDAYIAIGLGWLILTLFGALPFLFTGVLRSPAEAWFESMSGLTATGATVFATMDAVPTSIIVYRALLQYVAGLGIVILGISLLTKLTHGGAQLVAGDPTGTRARMRPRLSQTAAVLWRMYAIFSAVLFVLYIATSTLHARLPFGEAVLQSFLYTCSTISTGGFSSHTANITAFHSKLVEGVALLGMLVAGTSFALHDRVFRGDFKELWKNSEFRFYILVVLGASLAVTGLLWRGGQHIASAAWDAVFTVISFATSTGFTVTDHSQWPTLAKLAIMVLMFTGAMAGSTAGGLKMLRVMLLLKVVRRELRKLLHPRAVIPIRHAGAVVKEQTLLTIIAYFFTYITVWLIGSMLLIATEPRLGIFDGAAAAAAAIGNTGPAMGTVGPFEGYGGLQASSQSILALLMWIGRIEIFSAMLLLSPSSWRN